MKDQAFLGVIGGSGLYSMDGLSATNERVFETPFGKTSSPVVIGTLEGMRVAFLARHGIGHTLSPSEVPYRANIYAMKMLGVERIISISACGSLREDLPPGDIVIPDQIFDYTKKRISSYFGDGLVAHIGVAKPFCPDLSLQLENALRQAGASVHVGGTLITIEGPRFSTRAESDTFRSWGMSIIGMTACPEAFLAREAEICYSAMAHVTDYDVWHVSEAPVSVEMVLQTLNKNTALAQEAVRILARGISQKRSCECENALSSALISDPKAIPGETLDKLDLLVGKYLRTSPGEK